MRSALRSAATAAAVFITATNAPSVSATAGGASSTTGDVVIYAVNNYTGSVYPLGGSDSFNGNGAHASTSQVDVSLGLSIGATVATAEDDSSVAAGITGRQRLRPERHARHRLAHSAPRRSDGVARQRRRRLLLGPLLDAEHRRRLERLHRQRLERQRLRRQRHRRRLEHRDVDREQHRDRAASTASSSTSS